METMAGSKGRLCKPRCCSLPAPMTLRTYGGFVNELVSLAHARLSLILHRCLLTCSLFASMSMHVHFVLLCVPTVCACSSYVSHGRYTLLRAHRKIPAGSTTLELGSRQCSCGSAAPTMMRYTCSRTLISLESVPARSVHGHGCDLGNFRHLRFSTHKPAHIRSVISGDLDSVSFLFFFFCFYLGISWLFSIVAIALLPPCFIVNKTIESSDYSSWFAILETSDAAVSIRKSVHICFVLNDVIFFVLFHGDFSIYFLTRLVVNKTIELCYYLMVQHV